VIEKKPAITPGTSEDSRRLADLTAQNAALLAEIGALRHEIALLRSSLGWQILERCRRVQIALFPRTTIRGRLVRGIFKGARLAFTRPLGALLKQAMRNPSRILGKLDPDAPRDIALLDQQYQGWLSRNAIDEARRASITAETRALDKRPLISILMPVYNPPVAWLQGAIDSVTAQIYPDWELCIADDASTVPEVAAVLRKAANADPRIKLLRLEQNEGICGASNRALGLAKGEFVSLLDHDDCLTPDALYEVVKQVQKDPCPDFIYSDHDIKDPKGSRVSPMFKPDWSPDLILSMNYITHFATYRREIVQKVGGFRKGFEGSQDYDLILRVTEQTKRVAHIPRTLYSWGQSPASVANDPTAKPYAHEAGRKAIAEALDRRGEKGEVIDGLGSPYRYRVKRAIKGEPLVSILIPTRNNRKFLKTCLESLASSTYKQFEVLVLDNDSDEPETLAYLEDVRSIHRVLPYRHPFDFARINNFGAAAARGEYLVLLNDDTSVIEPTWIEAMLEHAQRPEVGAVGAKLLFPGGELQHAGVVVGISRRAGHAFWGFPGDHPGYWDFARVIRNYSAVTAACLMTRKAVFDEVGGFDEAFAISYNDVDLCLRMRAKGYLVVYTPYAVLYHYQSASRGPYDPVSDKKFEDLLEERWGGFMDKGDPYYNPNLTLDRFDFGIRDS
jgi:GT2 family glycosyltransferase